MTPVHFDEENCTLTGAGNVQALPVYRGEGMVVSCWRPTWQERLSVMLFGRIWLYVMHPQTQPPVYIGATRSLPTR